MLAGFMVAAFADSPYDVSDAWFSDGGSQMSGDFHVFGLFAKGVFPSQALWSLSQTWWALVKAWMVASNPTVQNGCCSVCPDFSSRAPLIGIASSLLFGRQLLALSHWSL